MKTAPSHNSRRCHRRLSLRKDGLFLASGALLALACACHVQTASAQVVPPGTTLYWDANGATPGAGNTPTGTWGGASASPFWTTDPTGSTATTATGPGPNDLAVFTAFDQTAGSTTNATNGYTVTLGAAQSVYGLNIGLTTYNAAFAGNDGQVTFTGASGLTIGTGGVTLNSSSGDPSFASGLGTLTLGADQTWNINNLHVINTSSIVAGNATAGNIRNWTLGYDAAYNPTFSGVISNGAGGGTLALTVNNVNTTGLSGTLGSLGGGTWTISNTASTYTGGVTVAAGSLQFNSLANTGSNSSLGAGGAITLGSATGTLPATLTYNGGAGSTTNRAFVLAGNGSGSGPLTIQNNVGNAANTLSFVGGTFSNPGTGAFKTLTFGGSNLGANTFSDPLADPSDAGTVGTTLTVAKTGAGLWVLNGANTYTGGTTITGGTLSVGPNGTLGTDNGSNNITITNGNLLLSANSNVGAGQAITLNSGGIGVAFTPPAPPAINDNTGTNGGVYGINYTGTGGVTSEAAGSLYSGYFFLGSFGTGTYTGTTLGAGNPIPSSTSGATGAYRLGGGGGTLTFQNAGLLTGNNDLLAGGTGGGNVILPNGNTFTGQTTVQNGTLTVSSFNKVVGGTASSSLGAPTTVANGTINLGLPGAANTATLNYAGVGETTDRVLNLAGTGGTIAVGNSGTGLLVFSSAPTFSQTGAEALQLGAPTDTNGGTLGAITDSTAATAKTSLNKAGLTNSTWTIGASTYTGNTTVTGGVLNSPDVLASSPFISLQGTGTSNYAVLQTNGTFARTLGGGAVTGQSIVNLAPNSGFAAKGGKLTVTLTVPGTTPTPNGIVTYGSNNFLGAGGSVFAFGSTTADSQVEFTNPINLATGDAFQRQFFVEKGLGGDSALLSGVITNGTGTAAASGLAKLGKGTLILSGANTFSGIVSVSAGTLVAAGNSTGTTSGVFGTGRGGSAAPTAPSAIPLGDGATGAGGNPTVQIAGAFSINRPFTVTDNGTNNAYAIAATTDAASSLTGLITATTGNSATNNNTFTISQVATTGTNALTLSGGIADNSVAAARGVVNFNAAGAINVTTTGITGIGGVTKTGAGALTLSAASSYTGATTVSAGTMNLTVAGANSGTAVTGGTLTGATAITLNAGGTLLLSASNALNPASPVGMNGGTLRLASGSLEGSGAANSGGTVTGTSVRGVGLLTLTANSTLSFAGTSGTAVFNGFAPGTFTLNVTGSNFSTASNGTDGSFDRLIFTGATGFTGLTTAQLAQITFNGQGGATEIPLDTGFFEVIAAVPEPSTWVVSALCLGVLGFHLRRRTSARQA